MITPDTERARLAEEEKAFMEREMKNLQKKFEAERRSSICSMWRSRKRGTGYEQRKTEDNGIYGGGDPYRGGGGIS